jgi:hypothetical protein
MTKSRPSVSIIVPFKSSESVIYYTSSENVVSSIESSRPSAPLLEASRPSAPLSEASRPSAPLLEASVSSRPFVLSPLLRLIVDQNINERDIVGLYEYEAHDSLPRSNTIHVNLDRAYPDIRVEESDLDRAYPDIRVEESDLPSCPDSSCILN